MNNNKTVGANEVVELLRKSDSITLLCHTAPDEDTVCSAYALYLALQGIGKEVKIYSPSKLPPRASSYYDESVFSYSPYDDPPRESSLTVTVDVATSARLGSLEEYFGNKVDVRIDHHAASSDFALYNYNDPSATAVAQLIFEIIKLLGVMSTDIASSLYTAVLSDSGGFKHQNMTAKAHYAAAELIECGADVSGISDALFGVKTHEALRALHLGLEKIRFICAGKVAIISITNEDKRAEGISDADLDELSAFSCIANGVLLGIVLKESSEYKGEYKVSMRSKPPVDASAICKKLGGGGHECASGATIYADNINEAEEILLAFVISGLSK